MTLPVSAALFDEIETILEQYSEIEARLPVLLKGSKSDVAEAILCLYCIQSYLLELGQVMPGLGQGLQSAIQTKRQEIALTVQMLRQNRQSVAKMYR